jgi:hypothetical protein
MKVYKDFDGEKRLIGRASVPDDAGPVYEVRLFGASSIITEQFVLGAITYLPPDGGVPVVELAVIVGEGQHPSFLPGWTPLAS